MKIGLSATAEQLVNLLAPTFAGKNPQNTPRRDRNKCKAETAPVSSDSATVLDHLDP